MQNSRPSHSSIFLTDQNWPYGCSRLSHLTSQQLISAPPLNRVGSHPLITTNVHTLDQDELAKLDDLRRLAEIGKLSTMIVHEVRNPLSTIMMGLQSFQNLSLPEPFQLRLNIALEEADRLQRLLDEILLYAKPPSLDCSTLDLNILVEKTLKSLQDFPAESKKKIIFRPEDFAAKLYGDPDKLKQVLINLLTNADEASNIGDDITLQIQSIKNSNIIRLKIHNWGQSILPDKLDEIFLPFYTTKPSGNGLGLPIVKHIIEEHGGKIEIESNLHSGTSFTIDLPVSPL